MSEGSDQTITLIAGSNKGIGFETARRLKAEGHKVYLGARNLERGQKAAHELGVTFIQLDVTDEAFLFTHAEVNHLFRHTCARTPAWLRRRNLTCGFGRWDELSLAIA